MHKVDNIFLGLLYALLWLLCVTTASGYQPYIELCISIIFQGVYMGSFQWLEQKSSPTIYRKLSFILFVGVWISFIQIFPHLQYFVPTIFIYVVVPKLYMLCSLIFLLHSFLFKAQWAISSLIIIIALIAYLFNHIYMHLIGQQEDYHRQIDTLRHKNQQIRQEQQRLLTIQNSIKEETMLTERRRLINDIHDILGHQLSGAIIQLAAIEFLLDNPEMKDKLKKTRLVLDEGMNNIRKIIHHERDASIDLKLEVDHLVDNFQKCPIHYIYQFQTPPKGKIAYSIVHIIKEALTNINKHSNASQVKLHLKEVNQQWIILIHDNGHHQPSQNSTGIGLLSMEERVLSMNGNIHIHHERGFHIFINIPITEREESQ